MTWRRPSHPAPTFVTTRNAPLAEAGWPHKNISFGKTEGIYFSCIHLTRFPKISTSGKSLGPPTNAYNPAMWNRADQNPCRLLSASSRWSASLCPCPQPCCTTQWPAVDPGEPRGRIHKPSRDHRTHPHCPHRRSCEILDDLAIVLRQAICASLARLTNCD